MDARKILSLTFAAVLLLSLPPVAGLSQDKEAPPASAKIEAELLDLLSRTGQADFIIVMADQADLSAAFQMTDWNARGQYVYDTLTHVADRSQAQARTHLDKAGLEHQTFFAGNELYVWAGTLAAAQTLAGLPEVGAIRASRVHQIEPPVLSATPDAEVAWGIQDTRADDFWADFGIKGEGIVVANIDSGVDYTHDALYPNYRCGDGPHEDCWYDPSSQDCSGPAGGPCDTPYYGNYHGTHTMGTMVAKDDPALAYTVGMAPDAQWIACLGCPNGSCSDFDLNACADWILAPGGNPDNRPHIVNNSWGGYGGDAWYLPKVNAWRAAGVFPAFSAGNAGPDCYSLGSPGDYQESFGSAAHQSSRVIGSFSSRGPSAYGHDAYTKPNISAPGEDVISTQPGDSWTALGGTSMASPHTAGAVALLWSCNPALVGQIDQTFEILQEFADHPPDGDCGAPPDGEGNYTYGYGYLNPYAAGLQWCGETGTLAGHVYEVGSDVPLSGVRIEAERQGGGWLAALTDDTGAYGMTAIAGLHDVTASRYGYLPQTITGVEVLADTVTTQDFSLDPAELYTVDGTVTDVTTGWPLYARLDINGYPDSPVWTDPETGYYRVDLFGGIQYTFHVSAWSPGYLTESRTVGPLATDRTESFQLLADPEVCVAPGYAPQDVYTQRFEDTDGGFVASGWNSSWEWGVPTSGPGAAHSGVNAWATNLDGSYLNSEDSTLSSPDIDLSAYAGQGLLLSWYQWLQTESYFDYGEVQVSNDGGASWSQVYGWVAGNVDLEWMEHHVWLDASYAVYNFRVRFHLQTDGSVVYPGWYIDDVVIAGNCQPEPGGLVVGNVYDANTAGPLPGADVSNDSGRSTTALLTPEDPAVDDAFYVLFSPAGSHTFTVTMDSYLPNVESVTVIEGDAVRQDFALAAGWLSFTPSSIQATVDMGSTATVPSVLSNNGDATATFEMREQNRGGQPSAPIGTEGQVRLVKESKAPVSEALASPTLPLASGGPDPFGYVFADSNEPNGPTYDWIEIAPPAGGNGAPVGLSGVDDGHFWPLPLPFPFTFYGREYTQLAVASNGTVYFEDTYLGYGNTPIPGDSGHGVDRFIAHLWDDLYIAPGEVYYLAQDDKFIIEYYQVSGCCTTPGFATWQVILFAGGNVLFQYQDASFDSSYYDYGVGATIGIQDIEMDPTWGLQYSYDAPSLADGLAICFAYPGNSPDCELDVPWLSEEPVAGTVTAGGSQRVDVTMDASVPDITQPGDYYATLLVANDTPYGPLQVPVTMTVIPPSTWGTLEGTITGLGACDENPAPLEDAEVLVEASDGMSRFLTTNGDGHYELWLDEAHSPLTITVSHPEHEMGQTTGVIISAQETTIVDLGLRWLRPCVSVEPASLEATVLRGTLETRLLRLHNKGAASTPFTMREKEGTVWPPEPGLVTGQGEWLYHAESGVEIDSNRGGTELAYPKAYRWQPDRPTSALNILVYADDFVHTAPNTFVDQALKALGLPYTAHYDGGFSGFASDLGSGGPWDLVIFQNDTFNAHGTSFPEMLAYIQGGGKYIAEIWTMLWDNTDPLYAELGVRYVANDLSSPPVYWWDPTHPIFTSPEGAPPWLDRNCLAAWSCGQYLDPTLGVSSALAGYTMDPAAGQGSLILRDDAQTVFKGFADTTTDADADNDGMLDGVELWMNLVDGIESGFARDVPWLSEQPSNGVVNAESTFPISVTFTAFPTMTAGVYTATVIAATNDAINPRISIPATMTVVHAPVCSFESSSPDELGETTFFTNTTDGGFSLTTYAWQFGDGSPTSIDVHPSHRYEHVGLYTVVLTATNSWGETTCSDVISIDGVEASFVSNSPVVPGAPVVFTNRTRSNPPIVQWFWTFGDSQSSEEENPVHTYAEPGIYTVTLFAANVPYLVQGSVYDIYQDTVMVLAVHGINYLPIVLRNH
jgi:PKD repeat protein/subtilisin family serine protease